MLAASLLAPAQTEQTQAQPATGTEKKPEYTYRTTTRLVILDLVATDAEGKIVTDLKPEEVQIFENGKEQAKHDFGFMQPEPTTVRQAELHLPPDVFTNARQYS
jgi:hypothetical protein